MGRIVKIVSVLLMLGLAASFAIPNLILARNRSRQKRTMAYMRDLATALEARAEVSGSYSIDGIHGRVHANDLKKALVPTYIREVPVLDGWGNPFDFSIGDFDKNGQAQGYLIRSFGSDGRADATIYASRQITKFSDDVVYANGTFVWFPDGM